MRLSALSMNGQQHTNGPSHGPTEQHPHHLQPRLPRPAGIYDQTAPIFMQPLLPPTQTAHLAACSSTPNTSVDFFTPPPAFQGPPYAAHLQQLQEQEQSLYRSGDSEEGYTLEFPSLEAFQCWRSELQERESVEFIKGDTHRSKADPPRFNEHTKLICARHCKSAKDRYLKTPPERNRSIPGRKIEGEGCPASISYKTYYGTPIVRVMYFNQHSHAIGPENLPFTRHGRKLTEHDRKMQHHQQQQAGPSRTNNVMHGNALPTVQGEMVSKNKEVSVRNSGPDTLRIEPPPMASLKPPDASPVESAGVVGALQEQRQEGFVRGFAESSASYPSSTIAYHRDALGALPAPPLPVKYEQSYDNNISQFTGPRPAAVPYTEQIARSQAYRAPPPPPPSCNRDTRVLQPQPTYLPQTEAPGHQAQYLPTPTTPSSQIQPLYAYPYSYSCHAPIYQLEAERQHQNAQYSTAPQASPISPVTPHTQTLPGPPMNRQSSIAHYSQQEVFSFSEDRWNRLETLFQAVRLRARSYVLPEPTLVELESLLSQLYMEGQQGHPRSEGEQLYKESSAYHQ